MTHPLIIDGKKYEGHTPAPWRTGGYDAQAIKVWTVSGLDETENWIQVPRADRLLAVDAPLLLAEVIRLRSCLDDDNRDIGSLIEEVKRLREGINIAGQILEAPNMDENTRKNLLKIMKEMIE